MQTGTITEKKEPTMTEKLDNELFDMFYAILVDKKIIEQTPEIKKWYTKILENHCTKTLQQNLMDILQIDHILQEMIHNPYGKTLLFKQDTITEKIVEIIAKGGKFESLYNEENVIQDVKFEEEMLQLHEYQISKLYMANLNNTCIQKIAFWKDKNVKKYKIVQPTKKNLETVSKTEIFDTVTIGMKDTYLFFKKKDATLNIEGNAIFLKDSSSFDEYRKDEVKSKQKRAGQMLSTLLKQESSSRITVEDSGGDGRCFEYSAFSNKQNIEEKIISGVTLSPLKDDNAMEVNELRRETAKMAMEDDTDKFNCVELGLNRNDVQTKLKDDASFQIWKDTRSLLSAEFCDETTIAIYSRAWGYNFIIFRERDEEITTNNFEFFHKKDIDMKNVILLYYTGRHYMKVIANDDTVKKDICEALQAMQAMIRA